MGAKHPIPSSLPRLLLFLAGVVLLAAPAAASADCPDADLQPAPGLTSLPRIESSVLCLLNQERTSRALVALQPEARLAQAATGHSTSMRWNSFFSHDSPDGSPFSDRIAAAGYVVGAGSWFVGENIAWGTYALGTPRALMVAWMNSQHHRDNILEPRFREIGVGADWGSPLDPQVGTATIVTTDFGVLGAAKKSKKKKKKRRRHKRR
jgi:uncharacterized protein YkwD